MRMKSLAATLLLSAALPAAALADPVGTFALRGVNPDGGEQYEGKVTVTRTGETYKVVWHIAGQEMAGIGIGLKNIGGRMQPGPASKNDTGLSIAYQSGEDFGTVIYTQQADGGWHGIWAYQGSKTVATEDWLPPKGIKVTKAEEQPKQEQTDSKSFSQPQSVTSPVPSQSAPNN